VIVQGAWANQPGSESSRGRNGKGAKKPDTVTMMVSANCKDTFIISTQNFKTQRNYIGFDLKKLEIYVLGTHMYIDQ